MWNNCLTPSEGTIIFEQIAFPRLQVRKPRLEKVRKPATKGGQKPTAISHVHLYFARFITRLLRNPSLHGLLQDDGSPEEKSTPSIPTHKLWEKPACWILTSPGIKNLISNAGGFQPPVSTESPATTSPLFAFGLHRWPPKLYAELLRLITVGKHREEGRKLSPELGASMSGKRVEWKSPSTIAQWVKQPFMFWVMVAVGGGCCSFAEKKNKKSKNINT